MLSATHTRTLPNKQARRDTGGAQRHNSTQDTKGRGGSHHGCVDASSAKRQVLVHGVESNQLAVIPAFPCKSQHKGTHAYTYTHTHTKRRGLEGRRTIHSRRVAVSTCNKRERERGRTDMRGKSEAAEKHTHTHTPVPRPRTGIAVPGNAALRSCTEGIAGAHRARGRRPTRRREEEDTISLREHTQTHSRYNVHS